MMEILGLPLHPLIVHATVIIVPLAGIGGLAVACLTRARDRYGWLVVAFALLGAILTLVTQLAGSDFAEAFQRHTPEMERHFALGNDLLPWTIALFVGTVAVMIGWRQLSDNRRIGRLILLLGMIITVVSAIVSIIQVLRIGHAGAVAVWGGMG